LLFEKHFGSDRSYDDCKKSVEKKLAKAFAAASNADDANDLMSATNNNVKPPVPDSFPSSIDGTATTRPSSLKRKREDDGNNNGEGTKRTGEDISIPAAPSKRSREDVVAENPIRPSGPPTTFREIEEQKKGLLHANAAAAATQPKHTVRVGKLEYPAHPYTVRVSFLSPQTEDMDLVDALRPRCGAIVHAKITRDKHQQGGNRGGAGKSKGWGLVQFEERESVETALGLSEIIGIKSKSVTIERSHLSAVGLVPSGMHRVNPKGEGRSTKRNIHLARKRKDNINPNKGNEGGGVHDNDQNRTESKNTTKERPKAGAGGQGSSSSSSGVKTKAKTESSIFAFRPRGVIASSGARRKRKAKISISSTPAKPSTKAPTEE